ncbi:Bbp16 family capsid cement protein [Prosthecochloris sp.]|uniref:Bbp16 family capsid cement protein n=1 Tax=Prosthecochloris sp. TaxID=290513 RepID=UPI002579C5EE|nr:hypothetical protein [Prosthecochloris sp.]
MPISDNYLWLAEEKSVTSTGDTASDSYDHQVNNDPGHMSADTRVIVVVDTNVTSGGAATVAAVLQDSDDNSSFADVLVGKAHPKASLVKGFEMLNTKLPIGIRQYSRVVFRVATAALTAGKFNARYQLGQQRNIARPSNV